MTERKPLSNGIGEIDASKLHLLSGPDTKSGKLQRICFELLREHRRDGDEGIPTNSRFLNYELMQRGVIIKSSEKGKRRGDQNTHDALTHLRENGIVPWLWLTDESRTPNYNPSWDSLSEWATTSVEWIRLNPWGRRPPRVLTESRAVAGVLRNLAGEFRVHVFPTGGQCGGYLRTVIAPQLQPGDDTFYVGDWDLAGGQIEANTRVVLEREIRGELNWKRIALTEEQVDQYKLRKWVITKIDRRYKDRSRGTHRAVEAEALGQKRIIRIVRDQLNALLPEPLADVLEREAQQRTAMRRLLRRGGRS